MIGSWWTVKVEARPEENVLWSRRANRTEDAIARGGKLFLTTERLLFLPSRFEASNGVGPHFHRALLDHLASKAVPGRQIWRSIQWCR